MLVRYIKDLLYRNESVIIPNFGTITTEIVSAKIDERTNTFIPPKKIVKFDVTIAEDDGLLSEYISKIDNSSKNIADNFIKFEIDDWREKLKNGLLELENIGVFTLNAEGDIQFSGYENIFAESFGLDNLEIPDSLHDVPLDVIVKSPIKEKKKRKERKNTKTEKTSWLNVFIYGFLFLILGGFGWFFAQTIIENNARAKAARVGLEQQDAIIKNTIQDVIFEINEALPTLTLKYVNNVAIDTLFPAERVIDSTRIKAALKSVQNQSNEQKTNISDPIQTATENKVNTTQQTNSIPKSENRNQIADNARKFWVIEGVYKDPGNAINRVRELIHQGYSGARIVPKEGSNSYVAYAMFSTYDDANTELQKVKKFNSEAWILGN